MQLYSGIVVCVNMCKYAELTNTARRRGDIFRVTGQTVEVGYCEEPPRVTCNL